MAHDTNRKADKAPATYVRSASDDFVEFGASLPSGVPVVLVDEPPLLVVVLLSAE